MKTYGTPLGIPHTVKVKKETFDAALHKLIAFKPSRFTKAKGKLTGAAKKR